MDNYKKSYRNDVYEQQEYPSYQQDYYEPKYPSYGKDSNNYKSKKDSVNINKLNCINNNVNINGNNTGDINVGNSSSSATTNGGNGEGYIGLGSLGGNYGEGYSKQNKDLAWIINNNNTNTNVVSVGVGNQTVPPEPEPTTATLTVKKQVFGCDNIFPIGPSVVMDCQDLQNNSSAPWLDCNNSNISGSVFCQSLQRVFSISRYWMTKVIQYSDL